MVVAWTVFFRGRTHDFIVILLYRIVAVIHKNHSPKRKLSRELTGILTFRLRLSLAVPPALPLRTLQLHKRSSFYMGKCRSSEHAAAIAFGLLCPWNTRPQPPLAYFTPLLLSHTYITSTRTLMPPCFILFLVLFILWPPEAVIVRGSVRNTCYSLKPNIAQIGEFCRAYVPSE